jgi:hypothetical protein
MFFSFADPGCLCRILDRNFLSRILDPSQKNIPDLDPHQSVLKPKKPKKLFLRSQKNDFGCSSRISGSEAKSCTYHDIWFAITGPQTDEKVAQASAPLMPDR